MNGAIRDRTLQNRSQNKMASNLTSTLSSKQKGAAEPKMAGSNKGATFFNLRLGVGFQWWAAWAIRHQRAQLTGAEAQGIHHNQWEG